MGRSDTPKSRVGRPNPANAPPPAAARPGAASPRPQAEACDWRQFHDRLRDAAIRSLRARTPLALLLAEVRDLDQASGPIDTALMPVFATHVGEAGAVVRYGRATLIAILPDTDVEHATAIAEAFRRAAQKPDDARNTGPIDLLPVAVSGYHPHEPLGRLLQRGLDRLRVAAHRDQGSTNPT